MEKYFEILKKCPLFNDIAEEDLSTLLECLEAKIYKFDKKETILAEGEEAKNIGVVLSGSVQVTQMDIYGNRSIVANASEGELFCEAFACADEKELPISVISNEKCEIMFISCERVLHSCCNACAFHAKIIYNLMKNMARKNILFHQRIQITAKRTTREKLMEYLMIEARKNGSKSFAIPFDRQELADYLEVDRSGLSAEIGKLKKEGVIDNTKNEFVLL